jgi:phosphotransferase system HPr-like phosphotransfer protein
MKLKIRLDTDSSAVKLVGLATQLNEKVTLTDGQGMVVTAKSLLGSLYAKFDFTEIWLETEGEHYFLFKDFVVEE